MIDDIYEVEKEDYLGLLQTLKPDCCIETKEQIDDWHYLITERSKNTDQIFCQKIITLDIKQEYVAEERYYIINLPGPEESREPTGKLHIELKSPEELQAFFKLISAKR